MVGEGKGQGGQGNRSQSSLEEIIFILYYAYTFQVTPSNVGNVLSLDDQLVQLGGHQSTKILCDYLTDFIPEYFVFHSFIRIVQLFLKIENLSEQTS